MTAAQGRLAALREVDNVEWMKEVEAQLQELREALAATAATADRAAQDSFGFRTLG